MAKKTKKKAVSIMRSEMAIVGEQKTVLIKESYATAKRRALDAQIFVEVTRKNGKKLLMNKMRIDYITPID